MPCGVYRCVLMLGALAIKVPRLRQLSDGMRSNRWEREMWHTWRPIFRWTTLCPVYLADPLGLVVIMPRATQPVSQEEIDAMPDYYPDITSETKNEDHGRLDATIVALDYGLPHEDMVLSRREYYRQRAASAPAAVVPK